MNWAVTKSVMNSQRFSNGRCDNEHVSSILENTMNDPVLKLGMQHSYVTIKTIKFLKKKKEDIYSMIIL